jgi:hypothetical protein
LDKLSTRMILVEDLVEKVKGRLLDKIVKDQKVIYKANPSECPKCHNGDIVGVEVMGAKNGVLLWECEECYEMFLKYDAEETEIELQSAKGFWTIPSHWGYIPKRKFN